MITLTALQCRVIGVMLEKETTTPEQYPLSLNALTNACNQKSNREPVMSLSEMQVQDIIDELVEMKQLMVESGRVKKYRHRFCNSTFGDLQLTEQQRAIVCVLLLRGPQTPGELRTRTNRLAEFANVDEVDATLEQLQQRDKAPLVKKLEREPGKRESRYIHLFSDAAETQALSISSDSDSEPALSKEPSKIETRMTELEQEVCELKAQVARLSALIE